MKTTQTSRYLMVFILGMFLLVACEEYLEKTPESKVTDEDIFNNYPSFQGFLDICYALVTNPYGYYYARSISCQFSGESSFVETNYLTDIAHPGSVFGGTRKEYGTLFTGIIKGGWESIRQANLALQYLPLLTNATDEERALIEGQAYFFRAFHHGEIISACGGMPYIDKVLKADDDMTLPRLTYHEATEKIIKDLDKAIALLPDNWDNTAVGQERLGSNHGRITIGAAIGYKQRFLLYAASPLMNGSSGNTYTYNVDYAKRSAEAGWELIKLANNGVYSLVPMANYSSNFYNTVSQTVWTTETIFARFTNHNDGGRFYSNVIGESAIPYGLTTKQPTQGANTTFVDKFEMADGTRYKVEYDNDNSKRWATRDPRFYKNFHVDRDKVGDHPNSVIQAYFGTEIYSRPGNLLPTSYVMCKYWPWNVNRWDNKVSTGKYITPKMRLAEAYLSYAEAVTVAYGANGKAPGSNLTAVEAVNIVRARAGMPFVTSDAPGYDSFLDLVWNERAVELAYEDHYWYDIRRWYIAHIIQSWNIVDLQFDKGWTHFTRTIVKENLWEMKHYWLPLFTDQTYLYAGMPQNPGW